MSFMNSFQYFFRKATDWIFRKKSPALILVRIGASLITLILTGSWVVGIAFQNQENLIDLEFQSSSIPNYVQLIVLFVGSCLCVIGVIWELVRDYREYQRSSKKRKVVIEQRGLSKTIDKALSDCVKKGFTGQVEELTVDIRENIIENKVTTPDVALSKVVRIKNSLAEKTRNIASPDTEIVYGGLMPVPFTFLSGYLLDDESKISVYDWDRDKAYWRQIQEGATENSFISESYDSIVSVEEVVVGVSVSYPVDRSAINNEFSGIPKVYLTLPNLNRNNHWSADQVARISGDLFETIKSQLKHNVKVVHLILACQNSVAFRFGQLYDKRNLPELIVYQYERSESNKYPWGVFLPNKLEQSPSITFRHDKKSAQQLIN